MALLRGHRSHRRTAYDQQYNLGNKMKKHYIVTENIK
jgi:hypothetical protein